MAKVEITGNYKFALGTSAAYESFGCKVVSWERKILWPWFWKVEHKVLMDFVDINKLSETACYLTYEYFNTKQRLEHDLDNALSNEDYILASELRDKLKNFNNDRE